MATQELIDQRLDAVDRALLGLLSRNERLAVVADVESRLHATGTPEPVENARPRTIGEIVASGRSRPGRHRSRMAMTAGIVGIVALGLFVIMPLTYLLVAVLGEAIGEEIAYGLLALNILALACCGSAAVVMGITALVRLNRRRGWLGHGWAITGLCTGPVPALAGGLGMLVFVLPLSMELLSSFGFATGAGAPHYADVPVAFVPPNALPAAACASGTCKPEPAQWVASPYAAPVPPPSSPGAQNAPYASPAGYAPAPLTSPAVAPPPAAAAELSNRPTYESAPLSAASEALPLEAKPLPASPIPNSPEPTPDASAPPANPAASSP